MSTQAEPTPDKVMQLITGGWAAAILGSAAKHGVFNALEGDGDRCRKCCKEVAHFRARRTGGARRTDGHRTVDAFQRTLPKYAGSVGISRKRQARILWRHGRSDDRQP